MPYDISTTPENISSTAESVDESYSDVSSLEDEPGTCHAATARAPSIADPTVAVSLTGDQAWGEVYKDFADSLTYITKDQGAQSMAWVGQLSDMDFEEAGSCPVIDAQKDEAREIDPFTSSILEIDSPTSSESSECEKTSSKRDLQRRSSFDTEKGSYPVTAASSTHRQQLTQPRTDQSHEYTYGLSADMYETRTDLPASPIPSAFSVGLSTRASMTEEKKGIDKRSRQPKRNKGSISVRQLRSLGGVAGSCGTRSWTRK
jgi:hypothetical protein